MEMPFYFPDWPNVLPASRRQRRIQGPGVGPRCDSGCGAKVAAKWPFAETDE
jgi:hypothetical protein